MQNLKSADTEASTIHQSALVLDTHVDTPQRFIDEAWDFTSPLNGGSLNLETARQGNLAGTFFALWTEPTQWRDRYAHRTLELLDGVLQQVHKHPSDLALCTTPAEILAARAQNKFAILLGIEGGHSIENSLALLRLYHQLGVRYMTLTWANSNDWADSSGDIDDPTIPHHNGLTPFGHEVIREMNRIGMIVDVSHASDKTFWDVLETTRVPILATHSSARALTNAPRNLTDDQLRAIAKNNGAVMVNFYSGFIDENFRNAINQLKSERSEAHRTLEAEFAAYNQPVPFSESNAIDRAFAAQVPHPPLGSLIDHIDHIAKIAGIDHVGIGTDFDGISSLPTDIDSAADLPKITAALHARGYTTEQLHKILGGNLLRVFNAAQAAADSAF
jgi:membrane dipeptidase